MYHPIAPGTRFYRVTRLAEAWPGPLLGLGAYFTHGGRYNRPHQQIVYAADGQKKGDAANTVRHGGC
jgi:hypothetical protein